MQVRFDPFESKRKRNNFELHVRRVFFMDDCDDLMLGWLNIDKGVVDSENLSLSTSREALPQKRTCPCRELGSENMAPLKEDLPLQI